MGKRAIIGLVYNYNENWTGGNYYIQNLLCSLYTLTDKEQPTVIVYTDNEKDFEQLKFITQYPYLRKQLTHFKYSIIERIVNKCFRIFLNNNIIEKRPQGKSPAILFPNPKGFFYDLAENKVFWIPDFQEHYLPHFFKEQEIKNRTREQQTIADGNYPVIFSSKNALDDFLKLYPGAQCPTRVLNFAVTLPTYKNLDLADLLNKFKLPEQYFFCPNQFWAHKNHIVVLNAVKHLLSIGISATVAFSGKEHDYRNPEYFNELQTFVQKNNLQDHVRFLGFIDRAELLKLMENAIAVIQPSLFEGWSTVVEDCKALNKFIILSDLAVHREQITSNCHFFNPHSPEELANSLTKYSLSKPVIEYHDYSENIHKYAHDFITIAKIKCLAKTKF